MFLTPDPSDPHRCLRFVGRWVVLFGALLATLTVEASQPTVIVLSWDGLRHDALDRYELPTLKRLARAGARGALVPPYPSKTFPGHVTLATGVSPHVHGIVDNHFYDRERGWYRMSADTSWLNAEPIWLTAERQGRRAATYFWVGSEQDWRGRGVSYRMAPFDNARSEADKVAQLLAWLALPESERPQLLMAYFRGGDSASHRFGPASSRIGSSLLPQDAALAELVRGIEAGPGWSATTLLIVSDHGMTEAGEYVPLSETLAGAGIDAVVSGSTLAHVFLSDPEEREAALTLISSLDERLRVYRAEQAPASFELSDPQRTGDIVVSVPPPLVVYRAGGFIGGVNQLAWRAGWRFGGHGYDPSLPDMQALLVARGRGFNCLSDPVEDATAPVTGRVPGESVEGQRMSAADAVAVLGTVDARQVAPTISALLGIAPPPLAKAQPIRFRIDCRDNA